ncbi:hypothetical protein BGZ98_004980, partial [Dissophora globulifera]
MGNLPSSTSTEPLTQGKYRNMSTISLPPTIPRRHNIKDAERKEIFPISDEGAPPFPGRRGSIGFFRGKRARAPVALDHDQLFKNLQSLQELQDLDMAHCSSAWQAYQFLSDSYPDSNIHSLSSTPTTAATTPALTAAATPTTPVGPHYHQLQHHPHHQYHQYLHHQSQHPYQYQHNHQHQHQHYHHQQQQLLLQQYEHHPLAQSPHPTSPVAASIQDYHSRQEQKLATFMKRNLLPPHALLTPANFSNLSSCKSDSNANSAASSPMSDCCSNSVSPADVPEQQHNHHGHCDHRPSLLEPQSSVDSIPSTHDVPNISVVDWGNQGRWAGEQEWTDDIPEGLEHDGGPWDVMDRQVYTASQHIHRAVFKGQNYSAPLDFSKPAEDADQPWGSRTDEGQVVGEEDTEVVMTEQEGSPASTTRSQPIPRSFRQPDHDLPMAPPASSFSSMATVSPPTSVPSKENERSLVILSVGCGNTQWATEMALAHPQSAIHAINVSQIPSLPAVPETTPSFDLDNLFFYNLDDNSLRIPFVSNSVDYIHVRRFLPNVNKTKYLAFLRELVRVLKVDGYLELVEMDMRLRDSGVDSCWPSYWTMIGFDKLGIDTSLALNLGGIMRTMPGME